MAQRQLDVAVKVMVFGLALWGVLAGSVVEAAVIVVPSLTTQEGNTNNGAPFCR